MTPALHIGCALLLAAQGEGGFRAPEAVDAAAWEEVRRDGRIVAIDLAPGLPGTDVPDRTLRFPLPDAVDRVEVLRSGARRAATIVLAGGVRAPLSLHVLRGRPRTISVRFEESRLLRGFFRPLLDARADVAALVFRDAEGVQLRVLSLAGDKGALLLARTLDRVPDELRLRWARGDPHVEVLAGGTRMRIPGRTVFEDRDEPPAFVHPRASWPQPSTVFVDFGPVPRNDTGKHELSVYNPGSLSLVIELRVPRVEGWALAVEPRRLELPPGARGSVSLTARSLRSNGGLHADLEIAGASGRADPLARIALAASARPAQDATPPELDPKLVGHTLLPRRRVRLAGKPSAVRDESPPCRVGDPSGVSAEVGRDGAFELVVPLQPDGRVLLWTEDARGNRGKVRYLRTIRDETSPHWNESVIRLGLPVAGWTEVAGAAGAVTDETPPIWIEARIDGERHGGRFRVRADGSFLVRVQALPGQRIQLLAIDGAAPLNRSRPLVLGPVLPYVSREPGRPPVLVGPPHAGFRLVPTLPASGEAPETALDALRGTLDAAGRASIDVDKLQVAPLLRFEVEVPRTGRLLHGEYRLERD